MNGAHIAIQNIENMVPDKSQAPQGAKHAGRRHGRRVQGGVIFGSVGVGAAIAVLGPRPTTHGQKRYNQHQQQQQRTGDRASGL